MSASAFPLDSKELPPAPRLRDLFGPSFILLGLGLGSGELILWPYLSSNFGLGMVWAIVIGVTMQFFINMEVERYALINGESIFVGFARWIRVLTIWFIFSTFIGFGWPGIGLAGATILSRAFGIADVRIVGLVTFIAIGLILSLGKQLYKTVETLQKYFILLGTPFVFLLMLYFIRPHHVTELLQGFVGIGRNYQFLPKDIVMATFLGALAFSGAGGNLNLAQSFYVRDKGYGMGKYAQKIKGVFTGEIETEIKLSGTTFPLTQGNLDRFKNWWRLINIEHFLVFLCLGLLTMLSLTMLAYSTTFGLPDNPDGIRFVINEASVIASKTFPIVGTLFLLVAGLMLSSTQLTVLDSTSRIITENLLLFRSRLSAKVSRLYFIVLWAQIIFGMGIILSSRAQPKDLIVLSAAINGFAMFIYSGLLLYFNNTRLPRPLRPSPLRNFALTSVFLFFGYFCLQTIFQ